MRLWVVVMLSFVPWTVGCGDTPHRQGREVGSGRQIPVAEVLRSPEQYSGQEILLSGTIVEVCPTSGCWADLEDERHRVRLEFASFTLQHSDKGRRVRLLGKLKERSDPPVISTYGIEEVR